jgi:hypothetical protein
VYARVKGARRYRLATASALIVGRAPEDAEMRSARRVIRVRGDWDHSSQSSLIAAITIEAIRQAISTAIM